MMSVKTTEVLFTLGNDPELDIQYRVMYMNIITVVNTEAITKSDRYDYMSKDNHSSKT